VTEKEPPKPILEGERIAMNATKKIVRKKGLLTADMNGEAVMMDIETGKYYNLGDTGGRIWELLAQPMTPEELCEKLVTEYDVTREICLRDVSGFLEDLVQRGLATPA